jgi:peptidoglycan/LPS O-acetylase OafA/YrhL
MTEIKPGKTTTEFYLTTMSTGVGLVMIIFGALLAAGVLRGNENAIAVGDDLIMYGVALLGATTAGYGISRGVAKTAVKRPAVFVGGSNNMVDTPRKPTSEQPSVFD